MRSAIGLVCLFAGVALSGCVPLIVGAGAGVAGYHYVDGEMSYAVNTSVDKACKAVDAEVAARAWILEDRHKEVTSAHYRCRSQGGKQVDIDVARRSGDFTRIAIRFGFWGDEAESKDFIDKVKARL